MTALSIDQLDGSLSEDLPSRLVVEWPLEKPAGFHVLVSFEKKP